MVCLCVIYTHLDFFKILLTRFILRKERVCDRPHYNLTNTGQQLKYNSR
jgi:hypothetical protein